MSRRRNGNDGSLELLLDTICNTFGGVLFISILVVLLLNMSSPTGGEQPPDPAAQKELDAMREKMLQTAAAMEVVRRAVEQQKDIEDSVSQPNLKELVEKLRRARATQSQQMSRKAKMLDALGKTQTEVNETSRATQQIKEAIERSKSAIKTVEHQLQKEIKSRSETAKFSPERSTAKTEVSYFLKNGRLTAAFKRGPGGTPVLNDAEVEKKNDTIGGLYYTPKKGAGLRINPADKNGHAIAAKLSIFEESRYYVAIFVWPDSFEHFQVVKGVMTSKKYHYRLEPMRADWKVYFGQRSPGVNRVQ